MAFRRSASVLATSLALILNNSLDQGVFPSEWKRAFVVAIHKSGLRSKVENYRQVSLLSCPAKIFDRLMCQRTTSLFSPLISERQHGFYKGRSTTTNLVDFVSSVICSMENGQTVDALYLDFSRAFDSLSHNLLVEKMRKYGVPSDALLWLSSYLCDGSLQVRVNDFLSTAFTATSGVPQGSHLGPVLFLISSKT